MKLSLLAAVLALVLAVAAFYAVRAGAQQGGAQFACYESGWCVVSAEGISLLLDYIERLEAAVRALQGKGCV